MPPKEEEDAEVEEEEEDEVDGVEENGQDASGAAEKKKKKKKKSKGDKAAASGAKPVEEVAEGGEVVAGGDEVAENLSSQEQLLQLLRRSRVCEESRRASAERPHPFWDTQPVPNLGAADFQDCGPIDELKTPEEVRDDPYPLPEQFQWEALDVDILDVAKEIYTLLTENYVEDDDCMFRFDYSVDFLRWALKPPGYLKEWHLGVRVKSNGKLVGLITGVPATIQVYDNTIRMAEINFLCVHKKLRSKRLAPVLIKEITRRVNKQNIWQAVYTAGVVLPRPVSECRYHHRSLNAKKLIEVGFSRLGPRMTMARTVKLYKVPESPQLPGMRKMEKKDSRRVFELVSHYLKKFMLHPDFEEEELAHWMLPRENVVYSYVRESASGEVTDVCSFYNLPSSVLGNDKHTLLKAAYSYWNVATTVPLRELMYDALILAKQENFDVFNALSIMENESFLKELKFDIGDGYLQYYLYNWKCSKIEPSGIGLVLL